MMEKTIIRTFEDLFVWKKARELANAVYAICETGSLAKDFGLRDQLRRAAVSVMSNIAEGFERETTPDYLHFLFIAKGSAKRTTFPVSRPLADSPPDPFFPSPDPFDL